MSTTPRSGGQGTPVMSGPSTPKETLDIYRPIANQVSRPLQPLLASLSTSASAVPAKSVPSLFSLSQSAYTTRVQNKAVNFNPGNQGNNNAIDEAKAVKGCKRHLGDPDALDVVRRMAQEKEEGRRKLSIPGRKKRKRTAIEAGAELSYDRLKPLHHIHTLYLVNLLNLPLQSDTAIIDGRLQGTSTESIQSKLSKADFTGAHLCVTCSRNNSLTGIGGIVIEETASTFRLLTPESKVKVIPKNGTQFDLSFPAFAPPSSSTSASPSTLGTHDEEPGSYQSTIIPIPPEEMERYIHTTPRLSVPLLGTNFGFRSGDRAGRKFRPTQGGGGGSGWGEEWVKSEYSDLLDMLDDRDGSSDSKDLVKGKKGTIGEKPVKRKRGKARRKDPPAFGSLQVQ